MHGRRILLVALLLALAAPATASAHARLVRTVPVNASVLLKAPKAVRVVFDDAVRPGPGIQAVRNGGGSILAGKAHVEGGRTLAIPVDTGGKDGGFSVRWAIVSDDGHLESGVFTFAVGRGRTAPSSTLAPGDTSPAAGEVAWRWLFYAGLLGAVGVSLFALVARPRDRERVALFVTAAAILAAIGAGEEALRIGVEARAGAALGATGLAALVVATVAGAATLAPGLLTFALAASTALVVGPAVAGHALDRGVNRLNVAADALHLLGAAAWIGALVGFVAFRESPRRRLVGLAAAGVAVLGLTGVIRASSELVHLSQLWDTSYGRALLVKTGVLVLALALGLLVRARVRRRAGVELALVAGIVVAASVLVLLPPGRSIGGGLVRVSTAEASPPPPRPPRRALVLAKQLDELGVALELEPARTTAIVLSPASGGLDGLDVTLNGRAAYSCGHGCYRVDAPSGKEVAVVVDNFGEPLETTFDVPSERRPGAALLRRIEARYRALRSVFFLESLASGPEHSLTSLWRLEAPDRVSYQIPGGAAGIVIGGRRWDRDTPDAAWKSSPQTALSQPAMPWTETSNVHLVAEGADAKTLTFADPVTPAFFELTVDAKTLLPREVHMTAAAHFMLERFVRFNAPRAIYPPR